MKRFMFVGLGALLLTSITPLSGHAGNRDHGAECDDRKPDVNEDVHDINRDQFELQQAMSTENQKAIRRIRRDLREDREDLAEDRDCHEVSENE